MSCFVIFVGSLLRQQKKKGKMDVTFIYTIDIQHFRSWLCARSAVCVCVYWIYDRWWTVFNVILVLWPSLSHKPLKTCWKCLLKRPVVLSRNYLNTTCNKISVWSFVCELQILLYNHVRFVKLALLWQNVTGYVLMDNQNFIPDKIYFYCHVCPRPFSLSSTSKVPSSQFFLSSLLLYFALTNSYASWINHLLVLSVIRHIVMYYDHCKHHFGVKMQMWQDSHGLLPWLTLVAPHAGWAEIFKLCWFIVHIQKQPMSCTYRSC
jgi:hypothetical protein